VDTATVVKGATAIEVDRTVGRAENAVATFAIRQFVVKPVADRAKIPV
jgi:hypothetical protein